MTRCYRTSSGGTIMARADRVDPNADPLDYLDREAFLRIHEARALLDEARVKAGLSAPSRALHANYPLRAAKPAPEEDDAGELAREAMRRRHALTWATDSVERELADRRYDSIAAARRAAQEG